MSKIPHVIVFILSYAPSYIMALYKATRFSKTLDLFQLNPLDLSVSLVLYVQVCESTHSYLSQIPQLVLCGKFYHTDQVLQFMCLFANCITFAGLNMSSQSTRPFCLACIGLTFISCILYIKIGKNPG